MRYSDIPQFLTNHANYKVDVALQYLDTRIQEYINEDGLILNPDFQRGHVWTEKQQTAYVEYFLRGGKSGRDLYFNCPSWHCAAKTDYDEFVCVDGLQRITALRKFWNNELKVFGSYREQFKGRPREVQTLISININDLQTKEDVLQWYIEMNEGGTPHTEAEINRVKKMLEEERFRNETL